MGQTRQERRGALRYIAFGKNCVISDPYQKKPLQTQPQDGARFLLPTRYPPTKLALAWLQTHLGYPAVRDHVSYNYEQYLLHAQKGRMPRRIPHRRRTVPTPFWNNTARSRSSARSICFWFGLWRRRSGTSWRLRLMKGLTLVIPIVVASDGVWW